MEVKEARQHERKSYDVKFVCCPLVQGDKWYGRAIDVSVAGIAFKLTRRFEIKTKLRVEVIDGPTMIVEVVRHQSENDSWVHGCRILSMTDNTDFFSEVEEIPIRNIPAPKAPLSEEKTAKLQRALEAMKNRKGDGGQITQIATNTGDTWNHLKS